MKLILTLIVMSNFIWAQEMNVSSFTLDEVKKKTHDCVKYVAEDFLEFVSGQKSVARVGRKIRARAANRDAYINIFYHEGFTKPFYTAELIFHNMEAARRNNVSQLKTDIMIDKLAIPILKLVSSDNIYDSVGNFQYTNYRYSFNGIRHADVFKNTFTNIQSRKELDFYYRYNDELVRCLEDSFK